MAADTAKDFIPGGIMMKETRSNIHPGSGHWS